MLTQQRHAIRRTRSIILASLAAGALFALALAGCSQAPNTNPPAPNNSLAQPAEGGAAATAPTNTNGAPADPNKSMVGPARPGDTSR